MRLSCDDPQTATDPLTSKDRPVALVWVGFWLALVLVGAKAVSLGVPESWGWPLELARVSFRDVLFALALGVIGEVGASVLVRQPRLAAAARVGVLAVAAGCAFFSVVAYGVFESLDRSRFI